jgi:hypothetical protein
MTGHGFLYDSDLDFSRAVNEKIKGTVVHTLSKGAATGD